MVTESGKVVITLQDGDKSKDKGPKDKFQVEPVGSFGTDITSGYFNEEYLTDLQGNTGADMYDKMRRSETQVAMVLAAVKNPIVSAAWSVEPADETDEAKKHADLVEWNLNEGLAGKGFKEHLIEVLSFLDFGHSIFEEVHGTYQHPEFGLINIVKNLAFRSQRTIEEWNVDHKTGKLMSIRQFANGDLDRDVTMPAEFLTVYSYKKEGANYEGVSALRPCYGPYKRKLSALKMMAVRMEKHAIPTPIGKHPKGVEGTTEYANFKNILNRFVVHQSQYITLPEGWSIDLKPNAFDVSKIIPALDYEDKSMVKAFLANFLELGMSTSGGSWALSFDLSDFFLSGIEYVADLARAPINAVTIPRLVRMNFGPQKKYPILRHSGISDKAGKEFAEAMKYLVEAKIVRPDDKLEADSRKRYGLPEASEEGREDRQPKVPPMIAPGSAPDGDDDDPEPEPGKPAAGDKKKAPPKPPPKPKKKASDPQRGVIFAQKVQKHIGKGSERLRPLMEESLIAISDKLVSEIMRAYKDATPAGRVGATKGLSVKTTAYKKALKQFLASEASSAYEGAQKEFPIKKSAALAEDGDDIYLALPPDLKRRVKAQADTLGDTQGADVEKAVKHQYLSSLDSTDSEAILEQDLKAAGKKVAQGGAVAVGAKNAVAAAVNTARNTWFFSTKVFDEVESFTFYNETPESKICTFLAGKTFDKNDAESRRYIPPLHHNCDSIIIANRTGDKGNPEITALDPSATLKKEITLHEHCTKKPVTQSS